MANADLQFLIKILTEEVGGAKADEVIKRYTAAQKELEAQSKKTEQALAKQKDEAEGRMMRDRRGDSQNMVDAQAEMAMADFKHNAEQEAKNAADRAIRAKKDAAERAAQAKEDLSLRKELSAQADREISDYTSLSDKTKAYIATLNDATISKKTLKDAARGLAMQFPLLASVANLALNPISLLVASISGSFTIWSKRVSELTQTLGGIEMPDVSEDQISRIERHAKALAAVTTALQQAKESWASPEEAAKRYNTQLSLAEQNAKKLLEAQKNLELSTAKGPAETLAIEDKYATLGLQVDEKARRERLAAMHRQKFAMDRQAQEDLAAAGKVGSKTDEAAVLEKSRLAAEAAQKAIEEAKIRKDQIFSANDPGWNPLDGKFWKSIGNSFPFLFRYGFGTSQQTALDLEQTNINTQQEIIDSYQRQLANAANRDTRRDKRQRGEATQAASFNLGEQIKIEAGNEGAVNSTNRAAAKMAQVAAYNRAIADATSKQTALMAELARELETGNVGERSAGDELAKLNKDIEILKAQLENLRQQN
jgi:hypothetical protein